jgi:hypothetical protein
MNSMNLLLFKLIRTRDVAETILSLFSILTGIILTYHSAYLIYAYHFTSILFLFMVPMTELISELAIGLFLTSSGFYLLSNHRKQTIFYKLTGILIMVYPFNQNLIDFLRHHWSTYSLIIFIVFPIGLFLFLFMLKRKYRMNEENYKTIKMDKIKLMFVLLTYILIDALFYNWNYL